MCGVMKNKKKDALLKISIRIANKFVGPHFSDFTQKNETCKLKDW